MSFLSPPKPPTPVPPANPPATPLGAKSPIPGIGGNPYGPSSLISTSSTGLKRKATVARVSLIGG